MLTVTRWNPWTEAAAMHRDFDALFNRFFGETNHTQSIESFTPAADVRREDDMWKLSIALPGVSPDKVDIEVVGRTVQVRGEREAEHAAVASEIPYGRFERKFTLPEELDATRVQATYRHGMLELVLPLAEVAKPKRIAVSAADRE